MTSRVNDALRIGPRLRAARRERGFSITDVAQATGLTKGFISLLERDRTTASVASLVRICDALHVPVGTLFEPSLTNLVRASERPPINFGGEGVAEWLLTPAGQDRLQVIESLIEPGGGSGGEPYSLASEAEWVHVLAGRLELRLDAERYELAEGDSLSFSPREPHSWVNPSPDELARVLWVLAPAPRGDVR